MENSQKITLFENTPVPGAVAKLAVPTVLSSLVMVLYNMADTYFVGMLNDPVQNAPSPWPPRFFWPSMLSTTCSGWAAPA